MLQAYLNAVFCDSRAFVYHGRYEGAVQNLGDNLPRSKFFGTRSFPYTPLVAACFLHAGAGPPACRGSTLQANRLHADHGSCVVVYFTL